MKIDVKRTDIIKILSKTQNIVEKKNITDLCSKILLVAKDDSLTIYATNKILSFTAKIPANIIKEGQAAVSAKVFLEIVRELEEGDIQIKTKDNEWLEIKQGKSVSNLVGVDPTEYPLFSISSAKNFSKFSAKSMCDMIDKTIYSVSDDETRHYLNGVFFEQREEKTQTVTRMVSTDGHRLSIIDRKIKGKKNKNMDQGIIIPRSGLQEIKKILENVEDDFEFTVDGVQFIVRYKDIVFTTVLIEGVFPEYKRLVPKSLPSEINLRKETFLNSLKRVSLLSNEQSKGVTFIFKDGKMKIVSSNSDMGDAKEEMAVKYTGDEIKVGFNSKYILDILNSIHEDNIKFKLKDKISPGLLTPEKDSQYKCIVMPMRI